MKFVSSFIILCLVMVTYSPVAISEVSDEQLSNCEQQATELGIQEGEEFDVYVADCIVESESMMSSEEEMPETLTEGSE